MLTKFTIVILATLLFCSCNNVSIEPAKVKGIPTNAFWVGGSDGGNWYILSEINSQQSLVHFKIYHDFTGELLVDKNFRLVCNDKSLNNLVNIKEKISGYDGTRIYLTTINNINHVCFFE